MTQLRIVNLHLMGRFGNMLFQYAYARAYAEKYNLILHTDPWVGQKIFEINDPPIDPAHREGMMKLPRHNEDTAEGQSDIELYGYFQSQKSIDLYTRTRCREWFKWKPEILNRLEDKSCLPSIVMHYRWGDYLDCGYPVVSKQSFEHCLEVRHLPRCDAQFCEEEKPSGNFVGQLSFVPDFYRMTKAHVLLRSNSTFSWWAHVLADDAQVVYSPIIDGLKGGLEHDNVFFAKGNWPRLSNHSFCTSLNLKP